MKEMKIHLRRPHLKQVEYIDSPAKRKVVRAGRRSGKTTGAATLGVKAFLAGRRILYATPTQEQVERFWVECKRALAEPLRKGTFYKHGGKHLIELTGTEQRIRAKTAYNADTLRGDYADLLILDEYQLMSADAWGLVGAPMLLDNDGDAIFIYTTKRGKHHSKELYKRAEEDTTGRWAVFHFTSHDNPHLSRAALGDITQDMTALAYRMEILAEEVEDDPAALWQRSVIDHVTRHPPMVRVVVGVDPPGTAAGAECGIIVAGLGRDGHGYVLDDRSLRGSPGAWSAAAVTAYHRNEAGRIIGEVNNGGDMVEHTIRGADGAEDVAYRAVRASRGKATRAEPVVAKYERGMIHHVGEFQELEDQMTNWVPGRGASPDRVDALVWALTELMVKQERVVRSLR